MTSTELERLAQIAREELCYAQGAAENFQLALRDWDYAARRMNEIIGRLNNVSQSFQVLCKDLEEELKREEKTV